MNGLAERAVQLFKQAFHKQSIGIGIHDKIARVLFQYHSTTGISSAEMLLGRKLCSWLDLLKPKLEQKVAVKQQQQKSFRDSHCRDCTFSEGENFFAKKLFERKEMVARLNH